MDDLSEPVATSHSVSSHLADGSESRAAVCLSLTLFLAVSEHLCSRADDSRSDSSARLRLTSEDSSTGSVIITSSL